jgi:hypothetical protein
MVIHTAAYVVLAVVLVALDRSAFVRQSWQTEPRRA